MEHPVAKYQYLAGMCAMFSTSVLVLTWWPLLRDCTFYSVSLVSLVLFFADQQITWYESATLLGIYGSYGFFMKFNAKAEKLFKKMIGASNKVQDTVSNTFLRFTVDPLLQAAASNLFDEIFAQNLLGKNCILLKASI